MKNSSIHIFLNFAILLILSIEANSQASITRGSETGEIYISTLTYLGQPFFNLGILRSTDNGKTISLQYQSCEEPPTGEMRICTTIGDVSQGVLYNYGFSELWVSFDYGVIWDFCENFGSSGRFTSGCLEGEVYKCCNNPQGTIWRSTDYGNQFIEIRDDAKYVLEVGVNEGVLYGRDGSSGEGFFLHYSTNYGLDFITIPIDSTVAFWAMSGNYPGISRGAEPGELYLVSWWPAPPVGGIYKIFHSVDSGYTFTLKYTSEPISFFYWGVLYTAGREPGSFYVMRTTFDPTITHVYLYIDYSNDYGQTFTTYFHDLGDLVGTGPADEATEHRIKTSCYPNPFYDQISFDFSLPEPAMKSNLQIFNIHGNLIKENELAGNEQISWDGSGVSGQKVESGIYLYRITSGEYQSQLNKIVYIK